MKNLKRGTGGLNQPDILHPLTEKKKRIKYLPNHFADDLGKVFAAFLPVPNLKLINYEVKNSHCNSVVASFVIVYEERGSGREQKHHRQGRRNDSGHV
jgi:hypothetical protein